MKKAFSPSDRYLWFRPDSRTVWFRMAVPKEVQGAVGKKLIQCSLGTADRREASVLAGKKRAALFEEWGLVGANDQGGGATTLKKPTDAELKEAAVAVAHDLYLEQADMRRRELLSLGPWAHSIAIDNAHEEAGNRAYAQAAGIHVDAEADAERIGEILGFEMPAGSAEYERLCELITQVRASSARVAARRAEGHVDDGPTDPIVAQVDERYADRAKSGETILELFEVYVAKQIELKKKRPAGADQDRMVIDVFAEFVGRDRSLRSIRFEDAQEFVDALAKVPSGYKKRGDYRGLTVRQAIARAEIERHKAISLVTQQRYISTVNPFFKWLQSEKGGRRIRRNPFEGLNLDISDVKGLNRRPPFTADQITAIIHSPLFTGFLADGKEHLPGNKRADDWRYWLPLICLFTGARIGEVAQLRVDDIYRDHGIWCVEFRHDEKTGQRTKSDKARMVALHSQLLAIGLLAFVDRQKKRATCDGNKQLFAQLERGVREQYGDMPSAWWRDYLTSIGVKPRDGGGFGSHSFRHTMADQLRVEGHMDHEIGPIILGHAVSSVTGGYGQASQGTPQLSQSMIESVRFVPIDARGKRIEGGKAVDFRHLHVRSYN